jgi:predicted permease
MQGISDLHLVWRQLRKSPGFTATAVLMLAFGIGTTTAIFSVVNGVLLQPLPFPHANELVTLGDQVTGTNWGEQDQGPVTAPEVVTYARDTHSFSALGGYRYDSYELSGVSTPATILASRMTPSVFAALGVEPLIGRVFTEQEDQQKQHVVVLSYGTWKDRFNGSPNVLGTKIFLEREPYIVIGVMPRSFVFPFTGGNLQQVELWMPMSFSTEILGARTPGWNLQMVGRLKPEVTLVQAEADANVVAQQVMHNFSSEMTNFRIHPVVNRLQQITVLKTRPLLLLLFGGATVVLLIACVNFAGLLLVRAIRCHHENGIRLALGAPALALLRQCITESVVLSASGALIGIALAAAAVSAGKNLLPETVPLVGQITLNWTVVGFALLLALLTGVLCGLAPGFVALRTSVTAQMKDGGRTGSTSRTDVRLRSALVVLEIAMALVLLETAGLLFHSFQKMANANLGFQPDHVTAAVYSLPEKQYSTQAQVDTLNSELILRLRQLPGVQDVGLTSTIPTMGDSTWLFVAEGYVNPRGADQTAASPSRVTGDFFQTMGIPLLRGRYFTEEDNANSQLVVIVNHEFAEHYWPYQNPIGKRMRRGSLNASTPWMTVVGEVADAKLGSPDKDAQEQFYEPIAQLDKAIGLYAKPTDVWGQSGYIVVRSALPPEQMETSVRAVVRSIDPQLPLSHVQTMEQFVSQSEGPRRFNTTIISSFALAAVLLAGLGIYSLLAFSAASRVQEMAIRFALGAQRQHILHLMLASALRLAAAGCVLGLAGALAVSKFLESFLFDVSPFDPVVLTFVPFIVFALALTASAVPARRAAAVDPIRALRGD